MLDMTNCTYTTSAGSETKVSISALLKVIRDLPKVIGDIPEVPQIFRMNVKLFRNPYLSGNFIIMSDAVADALEEAMKSAKVEG